MSDLEQQILADLTDAQRAAVTHVKGPLLVLAGAGSGKTRVITRRVAYLMAQGVPGGNILAVTFTNKAANEMKQRFDSLLGAREDDPWDSLPTVSTFHSFAARVLRIHHDRAALPADYSIYDQTDRLRAVRLAIERVGLATDNFQPAEMESRISRLKNRLVDAAGFAATAGKNFFDQKLAQVYTAYERVLREADALDFDDLLLRLAKLLRGNRDFRRSMADRYQHVLIDEYQDTNTAQYRITRDLARPRNNVCATGDPDQSIYGWRGADLNNILRFERDFAGTTVVRLEQNYRSTKRILSAADRLIRHNVRRKHKGLWTENPQGDRIAVVRCADPSAEADLLADRIEQAFDAGLSYAGVAVFVRLNALTRELEEVFRRRQIPYQIARGMSFYGRKEIKDATSYLRLIVNRADRVALERVINTPTRGIGQRTVERLAEFAEANGLSLWEACRRAGARVRGPGSAVSGQQNRGIPNSNASGLGAPAPQTLNPEPRSEEPGPVLGRSGAAVSRFVELIEQMSADVADATSVRQAVEIVLSRSGLDERYRDDESASANLGELVTAVNQFDQRNDFRATLVDYLREVALISDVDSVDETLGAVTLMTLHAAKGLEFPLVFIIGCEEGLIPHERDGHVRDEEEERRLLFVGITRAMRQLILTHVAERMLHGRTVCPSPSPFLLELPSEVLAVEDLAGDEGGRTYRPGWSRRLRWAGGRGAPAGTPNPNASGLGTPRRDREDAEAASISSAESLRLAEQAAAEARSGWSIGTLVRHDKFGVGKVVKVTPSGPYTKATIDFRRGGLKAVILEMAPIERLLG